MNHRDTRIPPPPASRPGRLARAALLLLLVGAAAGCDLEPAPTPGEAEQRAATEAALDERYDRFTEAYARANVQLLMDEVYAPDAIYLRPASPILEGQDQFRGQFSFLERYARSDGPGPSISFQIIDRDIAGDLAYDIGIYTVLPPDASADIQGTQGKFVIIWKRNGADEWRIYADSFSTLD